MPKIVRQGEDLAYSVTNDQGINVHTFRWLMLRTQKHRLAWPNKASDLDIR